MKDKRSQAYSLTPFINGQIENQANEAMLGMTPSGCRRFFWGMKCSQLCADSGANYFRRHLL